MRTPQQRRRQQHSTVFVGMLLFAFVLVLLQLWLFVAVLENLIGGKTAMAIPAGIASVGILLVNVWMLRGILLMDRDTR